MQGALASLLLGLTPLLAQEAPPPLGADPEDAPPATRPGSDGDVEEPSVKGQGQRHAPPDDAQPFKDDLAFANGEPYRTPLAGRALKTVVFGERIELEARYRGDTLALNIGAAAFTPNIGGNTLVPFFAGYYKRIWSERRLRAVIAFVVNDVSFAESFEGGAFEALLHFDNNTVPVAMAEIVDGDALEFTAMKWGHDAIWLGAGTRLRVWPWNLDNDLQVQLYYKAIYAYYMGSTETGKIDGVAVTALNIPPDTYIHGVHARVRLDMLQRNILELPHYGLALGGDFEYMRRDRWEDLGYRDANGRFQFQRDDTRDYIKATAYMHMALPIPFLSERHRLLLSGYVGWMPTNDVDRFNGFRLGGGPPVSESADLGRSPFPGAMFDQFVAKRYLIASVEYRLELAFFAYLHLRATVGWGELPTYKSVIGAPFAPVRFTTSRGEALSVGLTTGFIWSSTVYLEYAYDTGALRANDYGHSFLISWSKEF